MASVSEIALPGLTLRGMIALLTRVGERLEHRLVVLSSREYELCRAVVDMSWSFATGIPASGAEASYVRDVASDTLSHYLRDSGLRYPVKAVMGIAGATAVAYGSTSDADQLPETLFNAATEQAQCVVNSVASIGDSRAVKMLVRDFRTLKGVNAKTTNAPELGPVVDFAALGPSGAAHFIGIVAGDHVVTPKEIIEKAPKFVCFYASVGDADGLIEPRTWDMIATTLSLAREQATNFPKSVTFVVYMPAGVSRESRAQRARLIGLGALVFNEENLAPLPAPTDLTGFIERFRNVLDRSDRIRTGWRFLRSRNEAREALLAESRDARSANGQQQSDYRTALRNLRGQSELA